MWRPAAMLTRSAPSSGELVSTAAQMLQHMSVGRACLSTDHPSRVQLAQRVSVPVQGSLQPHRWLAAAAGAVLCC